MPLFAVDAMNETTLPEQTGNRLFVEMEMEEAKNDFTEIAILLLLVFGEIVQEALLNILQLTISPFCKTELV
jgi:hypothetical protein